MFKKPKLSTLCAKPLISMKYYETEYQSKLFRIEEDLPEVGAYLFVYENSKCMYDYLQNSIKDCMEFAAEEFGVPINSWNEIVSK